MQTITTKPATTAEAILAIDLGKYVFGAASLTPTFEARRRGSIYGFGLPPGYSPRWRIRTQKYSRFDSSFSASGCAKTLDVNSRS